MEKEVYSLCFMCSIRRPIKIKVKDGQVTWIDENLKVGGRSACHDTFINVKAA